MTAFWNYLTPYEFSPTVLLCCALAALIYTRGLIASRAEGASPGFVRPLAFLLGLALIYAVMQTYLDYLAQYMFFIHRGQHLVLHHLAPFLVALAAPQPQMRRGLPRGLYHRIWRPFWTHPWTQRAYAFLQHPVIAGFLFVGLIYFWLLPSLHFDAMLSLTLYKAMNWSMVLDGLLFWWLVLDARRPDQGGLGYGKRILVLWFVMVPQIGLGAYITLSNASLYDVYAVCGRAWVIDPMRDQLLGGLITWLPSSMMSALAMLINLRWWLNDSDRAKAPMSAEPDSA